MFIKYVLSVRLSGWICRGGSGEPMVLYRQAEDNEDMNKLKGAVRKRYNWGVFGRLRVVLVADGTTED
jgi:hypothetical protein